MTKYVYPLLATVLALAACGSDTGADDASGITGPLAEPTTTSTTPSSTTTSTMPGTTTTTVPPSTTAATTSTAEPGSQYVGITYSDASEIDLHPWGGWHIAEIGPGSSGWDSPFWGSRWQSGDDEMLWFEKETGNGLEVEVLDVVTFLPDDGVATSGCIADSDGVDFELHGVAHHEGDNQWVLLRLWRADRAKEVWVELDPVGYVVEPATGSCELGAGDGSLP